jgi:hypothetical protein
MVIEWISLYYWCKGHVQELYISHRIGWLRKIDPNTVLSSIDFKSRLHYQHLEVQLGLLYLLLQIKDKSDEYKYYGEIY